MGFFTSPIPQSGHLIYKSQSLSGWDGVFHQDVLLLCSMLMKFWSQSLSGWDGVFHLELLAGYEKPQNKPQSLSGWDGVFHYCETCFNEVFAQCGRNPFQGGMGFFTLKIAD